MRTSYLRAIRLLSHDVRMYMLTSACVGISYFGILTVLLNLYLVRLGYSTAFIGQANGCTALAYATCSIPAGALGSRWSFRRTVIAGVSLLAISTALLPLAEFLPGTWPEVGVIAMRLLSGLGFALYTVNANPYLIAATTPAERNFVFSLQVAMPPVIGFVGNVIGGIMPGLFAALLQLPLSHSAVYRYPLIISGLLIIPAILGQWTTREISNKPVEVINVVRRAAPWVLITLLAVTGMLRIAGESTARTFFTVYLDTNLHISTVRIGLLTAVGQVAAGVAAMTAPALMARLGKTTTVLVATFAVSGSLLALALIPHWLGASLGFMGVIAMIAIANAVTSIFQMEAIAPEWRGVMSGVSATAVGIGYASMAMGGGNLIPLAGYRGLFLTGATLTLLSALIFGFYFRSPRSEYQ